MATLTGILETARDRGFVGPGDVGEHIGHARAFVPLLGAARRIVDLGSGGGVPGLVIAEAVPDARVALVEGRTSRAELLADAVERLGMAHRVTVVAQRAEALGRDPSWRAAADAVTARSFGPPAVVAECAAPLLAVGGRLVVSEPPAPSATTRWPAGPLAELGLELVERRRDPGFVVLEQRRPCPARLPRRTGVPAKRPLF